MLLTKSKSAAPKLPQSLKNKKGGAGKQKGEKNEKSAAYFNEPEIPELEEGSKTVEEFPVSLSRKNMRNYHYSGGKKKKGPYGLKRITKPGGKESSINEFYSSQDSTQMNKLTGEMPEVPSSFSDDDYNFILTKTCLFLNDKLKQTKRINSTLSGSTGVFVLVHGGKIATANVGDSRAIFLQKRENGVYSYQSTKDQTAEVLKEKQRILNSGGEVKPFRRKLLDFLKNLIILL